MDFNTRRRSEPHERLIEPNILPGLMTARNPKISLRLPQDCHKVFLLANGEVAGRVAEIRALVIAKVAPRLPDLRKPASEL